MNKSIQEEKILYKYKPNTLLIIGVTLNIIFASLFSVLLITMVITIPTILLNAMLLVPRTQTKKHYGFWRLLPITFSLLLSVVILLLGLGTVDLVGDIYGEIVNLIDHVIFWTKLNWNTVLEKDLAKDILWIIFSITAVLGNVFIIIGWYKREEIGSIKEAKNIK